MKDNGFSHMWIMVLACGGALLLVLVLPLLGFVQKLVFWNCYDGNDGFTFFDDA